MVPNSDGIHFSAWAPINGSLNYYNNRLEIHPSTNVKDDQALVLDHKSELRIHTELNETIRRFEEVQYSQMKKEEKMDSSLHTQIACDTHPHYQRYQWYHNH